MDSLAVLLTRLAAAFPRDNPTQATLATYVDELAHLDLGTLGHAIHGRIRNGRHFPTISEIREDYAAERHRMAEAERPEALPTGRTPMPEDVKAEIEKVLGPMNERAETMELTEEEKAALRRDEEIPVRGETP
jgi:hypothetical protein